MKVLQLNGRQMVIQAMAEMGFVGTVDDIRYFVNVCGHPYPDKRSAQDWIRQACATNNIVEVVPGAFDLVDPSLD